MKIAIASEDKTSISEHLGGAPYFVVVTVENDKAVNKETRDKPGHGEFADVELHPQLDERGQHGFGEIAAKRHKEIREVIKDCDVLITGRVGFGAYQDLEVSGLKVVVTDEKGIDTAVSLYIEDKLPSLKERIC